MTIYFSKSDPLGADGNIHVHFWNLYDKKNQCRPGTWGSDKQVESARLYPRGSVYYKLLNLAFARYNKNKLN